MPARSRRLVALAALAGALLAPPAAGAALPSGRTTYRSAADYVHDLHALAAANPGLVRSVVLPVRSVEGRAIEGVEIADGTGTADDGRPVALVVGLTHGREWPSGEVAMEYAIDLVARRREPRVAALLARLRTVVVPVANPDGLVATQNGQPDRRRNCRALPGDPPGPCSLHRGVDLNRNYGAWWGGPGAETSPDADTYRGPGPWSEPETQAMHQFTAALPVTDVVSLHNVGGLVLRQPGFQALGTVPDEPGMAQLGDAMAAATGYRSEPADALYDATGALEDWNYAAQGAYGYTVELGERDGDGSFHGSFAGHVTAEYDGMREALLLAGEEAADPRDHLLLRGRAPAGAVLRLHKRFDTLTATTPPFAIPDGLDLTLRVGATGAWRWAAGPSTRPFVARDGGREAWTLDCLGADGTVVASHDVVAGRGQEAVVDACTPGSGVQVAANPAARLLRVTGVRRVGSRVRARVTCARSCTARVIVSVAGRRAGASRVTLGPGVTSVVGVAVPRTRIARARRLRLAVSVVDSVGERASATREVGTGLSH